MKNIAKKTFTISGTFNPPGGVTQVTVVARRKRRTLGYQSSSWIDPFNNLYMAGGGTNGQIGNGAFISVSAPTAVSGSLQFTESVADYQGGTIYGIGTNGSLYGWGVNGSGQIGDGSFVDKSTPTLVVGALRFTRVSATNASVIAIDPNGFAYTWGINSSGQLAHGNVTALSSPVLVAGAIQLIKASMVYDSVGGGWFSVMLKENGTVYTCGLGTLGALGQGGGITVVSTPAAVAGAVVFADIATSPNSQTVCAIDSSGNGYAWGDNTKGAVGDGTTVNKSSPVAISGGLKFRKIVIGGGATAQCVFGITTTGLLYSWGNNANGELGLGDVVARSTPTAVVGALSGKVVTDVIPNGGAVVSQNCVTVLCSDGTAFSWGFNQKGVLGLGDSTPRSTPTAVIRNSPSIGANLVFLQIAKSSIFSSYFAVGNDGFPYAWGDNGNGQLGFGNVIAASSPTAVASAWVNPLPIVFTTTITVTPATAYPVTLNQYFAMFGNNVIGQGLMESVEVIYEQ